MKGSKLLSVALALATLLALSAGLSVAQGPAPQGPGSPQAMLGSTFTYQGQLKRDGNLVNDTCTMVFRLYNDPAVGNLVGVPITLTVTVADGLFSAPLNSSGQFGLGAFSGEARWLEVAILCPGDASFSTLTPRQALTAAPYALSLRPGALIDGAVAGRSALVAVNRATSGNGVWGQSDATDGIGVRGWASAASGETYGVWGQSDSTRGLGIYGYAASTTGTAHGVYGKSNSPDGIGVYGESATSMSGAAPGVLGMSWGDAAPGVYGYASTPDGDAAGVLGESGSTAGRGVRGWASATSGHTYGVYGQADSSDGVGVYGLAPAASGTTYGVYGVVNSSDYTAAGVRGQATSLSGNTYGVYGLTASSEDSAAGVRGDATALSGGAVGVWGRAESPDGIGVLGHALASSGGAVAVGGVANSPTGWGVYCIGNFAATGSKSAIVQTQGYGWRSLYSVESPEVLFEDVGTAQLVDGAALVPIEPIFAQTVNLEQPYQVFLTPQGSYCALYVAEKTPTSFTVRAQEGESCHIAFDYRIIARRLGYEEVRLAPAQVPTQMQRALKSPAVVEEHP